MAALPQPVVPPPTAPVALLERPEVAGWRDVFRAAPAGLAAEHGIRSVDVGSAVARAVSSLPGSRLLNGVIGLGVERAATAAQLHLVEAFNAAAGVAPVVALAPVARPASLGPALRAEGMRDDPPRMKFARVPHPRAYAPTDLRIVEATRADAGAIGCLVARANGLPDALGPWFAALVGRPRWRWIVACDVGCPVAVGGLFVHDQGAWATFSATEPTYRGRGAHSAILAARIRAAAHEGAGTIVTEDDLPAGPRPTASYRNIVRAGFHEAYVRQTLRRTASAGDIALSEPADRRG